MKHISIIIPETAIPAAIVDPQYMFTAINEFYKQANLPVPFKIQLVGVSNEIKLSGGLITVKTEVLIDDVPKTDLIIIPAISGNIDEALFKNSKFISWIENQYKNGAEVASLCIGAFLLGATGLLNSKSCSTHWLYADLFRKMFPEVNLVDDKVVTDQNGLYSSGGATSYWTLLLYLVEKYTSKEMAIMASKFFLLDIEKTSQSPFIMFRGQKDHSDSEIVLVQNFIESNYSSKLTVEELANQFNIPRRTLERRFKKATSNTLIEYLQRVKIEAAKKELENGRKSINEIMFDVGYNDIKSFRDIFKKYTGITPVNYKLKYNKTVL